MTDEARRVRPHLIDGEFQSDKYPETPRGKVPLSCKDPTAQDLLWKYAQRRRSVDAEFSDDLEEALRIAGFVPPTGTDESSAILARVAGYYYVRHSGGKWMVAEWKPSYLVAAIPGYWYIAGYRRHLHEGEVECGPAIPSPELCAQVERDQARIIELEAEVSRLREGWRLAGEANGWLPPLPPPPASPPPQQAPEEAAPSVSAGWPEVSKEAHNLAWYAPIMNADARAKLMIAIDAALTAEREAGRLAGNKEAMSSIQPQFEALTTAIRLLRDAAEELAPAGAVPSRDVGPPDPLKDAEEILTGFQAIAEAAKLEGIEAGRLAGIEAGISAAITALKETNYNYRDGPKTSLHCVREHAAGWLEVNSEVARALAAKPLPQPDRPERRANNKPLPLSAWHEDLGDQLWWAFPIAETPYVGSPLCDDWPGYHTHFTPIPQPEQEG